MLVQRLRNPGWIVQGAVVLFVVGYLGLLLAPSVLTWLWVLLVGSGTILFPVTLALINTRTTSTQNSASLSGFVQGIGYTVGATGPLLVGVLHDLTGGWTVPLIALLVTSLSAIVAGIVLARPGTVEDELERHRPRGST
jgi:CP family cyanate transporter-like MFS transporter